MKENSYSKSMQSKSSQELESIIKNKIQYTDEALLAVIWELQKRDIITENEIKLEESINKNKVPKETNIIQESNLNSSVFEELEKPTLYSKRALQGFTIFFSTIFGVVLMMYNLKATNKPKVRIQVLFFGICYTIGSVLLIEVIPKIYFINLIFNLIGYLILSEFFWNKHLGKDLKFAKKSVTKPLVISLLITFFLLFLILLPTILGEQNLQL